MSRIFDFNIHLPLTVSDHVDQITVNETEMSDRQFQTALSSMQSDLKFLSGLNLMILNPNYLRDPNQPEFLQFARKTLSNCIFTSLVDFRRPDAMDYVDQLANQGFSCIKFHSYIQSIETAEFDRVKTVAKQAESRELAICIDASFGTTGMFRYDNLALACCIAESITKVPVVILHSGGLRCLEAMLIALSEPNVYLETSFTLPFYTGSRIEADLGFAYKKIGADKILYASDAPYVDVSDSLNRAQQFFAEQGFSDDELEKVFFENAQRFIKK